MSRTPVIAANWKMNLTVDEARKLASDVVKLKNGRDDREYVLFPGFLQIATVFEVIKETSIKLGGQNLHYEDKGAFTGEVSALQLKDSGCSHVLVGHSERRHYFQENYEIVNRKVQRALEDGLKVMLCVGESLEEREQTITEMVVVDQLESAFAKVPAKHLANMYIAYEPIWAIGTGKNATPEEANHVHELIRRTIQRLFSEKCANEIRLLYGGSVKGDNIVELMQCEHIDGVLVGGASLKSEHFSSIMNYK